MCSCSVSVYFVCVDIQIALGWHAPRSATQRRVLLICTIWYESIYVCMYVCMYVCIFMYIYLCMYIMYVSIYVCLFSVPLSSINCELWKRHWGLSRKRTLCYSTASWSQHQQEGYCKEEKKGQIGQRLTRLGWLTSTMECSQMMMHRGTSPTWQYK